MELAVWVTKIADPEAFDLMVKRKYKCELSILSERMWVGVMHHSEAAPALSSPCTIGCLWPRDRRVIFPGLPAGQWGPGSSQSLSALSGPAGVGPGEKRMGPASCHWLDFGTPVPTPWLSCGSSPSLGCHASVVSLDSVPRAASLLSRYAFGQEPPPIPRCVWALLSWQSLPGSSRKMVFCAGRPSLHASVSSPVQWAFGPG